VQRAIPALLVVQPPSWSRCCVDSLRLIATKVSPVQLFGLPWLRSGPFGDLGAFADNGRQRTRPVRAGPAQIGR